MGDFSAEWLARREDADRRARSWALSRMVGGALTGAAPVRIVDLAAGTGANFRYLADALPAVQRWTLADRDEELLATVPRLVDVWAAARGAMSSRTPDGTLVRDGARTIDVRTRSIDLTNLADAALFERAELVTASALLDLVSSAWLEALASQCGRFGTPLLFALTYDGRMRCRPAAPEDEMVRTLINEHQRTDKGFGPALGPSACDAAREALGRHGYAVHTADSDWLLDSSEPALQAELIEGWAAAASIMAPREAAPIETWRVRRRRYVEAGVSEILVGHQDMAALRS